MNLSKRSLPLPKRNSFILYFQSFAGFSPGRFIFSCFLNILNTSLSGFGLLMLIPLLNYARWLPDLAHGDSTSKVIRWLPQFQGQIPLSMTLLAYITFAGCIYFIQFQAQSVQTKLMQDYLFALREKFNRSVASSSWPFLLKQRLKHVEHMLSSGLQQVSQLTYFSLNLLSDCIVVSIYFLFALCIHFKLTLTGAGCACLVLYLLRRHKAELTGRQTFLLNRQMQEQSGSFLDGVKLAKSYNQVLNYLAHYTSLDKNFRQSQLDFQRNQRSMEFLFKWANTMLFALIFYMAVRIFDISVVSMLALLLIHARLLPRISSLQQNYLRILNVLPIFNELILMQSAFERAQEYQESENQKIVFEKGITFHNVSYHYDDCAALKSLNCFFKKNSTTAVVGLSGAGKSTLADLLLGLLYPTEGGIAVDEKPLSKEQLKSWRQTISYVPQENYFFHNTVRSNLLWAAPDSDDQALWEALEQTAAAELVRKLPMGLDTVIGERGIYLSGGERQRIALARALLRKPEILLLDEATSALDAYHEALIFKDLQSLRGKMTLILIAHRLSTIQTADHVLVLDRGRLIEQGIPEKLLENTASYFNFLFQQQLTAQKQR